MKGITKRSRRAYRVTFAAAALAAAVSASSARAVTTYFFDENGSTAGSGLTTGGTYTWEDAAWTTTVDGTGTPATWVESNFPRLAAGADATTTTNYTITANANHTITGIFLDNGTGVTGASSGKGGGTVTINGPGVLSIISGANGFSMSSSAQSLVINAKISGPGSVQQSGSGALSLYGANDYAGGFTSTGGQVTNYNNSSSFGTGTITLTGTGGQGFVNNGPAGLTIANNVALGTTGNTTTNFASGAAGTATAGVIFTGKWTLPTSGTVTTTIQPGPASTVTKVAGVISGGSKLTIGTNPGTFIFSNVNTYTNTTTINAGTLKLGAANSIASSNSIVMGGGTFNPGGFNQAMTATTLGLNASSKIDFGSLASEIDFAGSSGLTWNGTATLSILNFDPSIDKLRFGTDATGLTSAQLAEISINGSPAGSASIDSSGFVSTPEPSSALLLLAGGGAMAMGRRRRRDGAKVEQ